MGVKLTIKQEKFCHFYIETGNASEAYRKAFLCDNMKEKTIWEKSSLLLAKDKVRAKIDELRQEMKEKSDITKEMVLNEFKKIGFSNIAYLHNTWIELKEFDKLTDDQKACIKSISTKVMKKNIGTNDCPEIVDVEFVKIELYDKLKALEDINKMLGFDQPEKTESDIRIIVGG